MKAVFSLPVALVLASGVGLASAANTSSTTTATTATTTTGKAETKQVVAAGNTERKTSTSATAPATRNWAKADANRDNLISPEEMEAYIAANPGPLRSK